MKRFFATTIELATIAAFALAIAYSFGYHVIVQ